MKIISYQVTAQDKALLVQANQKKHDFTFITNSISEQTLAFAGGKDVLVILNDEHLDERLLQGLSRQGLKYLATATQQTANIDLAAAGKLGFKIANVPMAATLGGEARMLALVKNLDQWAAGKCVGKACCCQNNCAVERKTQENQHGDLSFA
ncbi:hypothetical protein C7T94_08970 [Pedobacter yulinensis]|uniref:D-isomer specific 2-hydroxyacid dehydrogenase catalytic domain-containing protein n=1 Tax=Pedobacter yulinensis TaxID=2126353 RepID=A0A2T3HK25_9SPHI|nr:hypothetical protein [Pedobacter yulinensis]PST82769.1 hypothetical protein C7T94_08970 [Pedobacter yulinensis]